MTKVVPIKSGTHRVVKDKKAELYDVQAGVSIDLPDSIVEKLKKKGLISAVLEKKITTKKEGK